MTNQPFRAPHASSNGQRTTHSLQISQPRPTPYLQRKLALFNHFDLCAFRQCNGTSLFLVSAAPWPSCLSTSTAFITK